MVNEIRKLRIFSGLPDESLLAVAGVAFKKKYEKGMTIIWAQDECQAVYFILSGAVEIYRQEYSGREQVLEILKPGEIFNLVPIFMAGGLNQANARVVSDAQILSIEKEKFRILLEENPEISRTVSAYFAMRLSHMVNMVESLGLHSVRRRMAGFLISQANQSNTRDHPRWTQEAMARQLGTVRDVIGRTLRKFEDDGLIRFQRQHILLLDRDALQHLADGKD